MLDLKFIRNNPELVKNAVKNKNEKADIDYLLELDEKQRKVKFEFDQMRTKQNQVSKSIGKLKKEKKDVAETLQEMKVLAGQVKELSAEVGKIDKELKSVILTIPNIPADDVPVSHDENENELIHEWGEKPEFSFTPKNHVDLCNDLLDINRGAKITGSGFPIHKGRGALLERALINFMLDYHIFKHDYTEVRVPYVVNRNSMTGTGQLPKLAHDMYHINEDDLFLIPTAEVPVTNMFAGEILSNDVLPLKYAAYSPCFRREAGSYGKDTRGLQRIHQFNKVEMVRFVKPENSYDVLEEMLLDAEDILQELGLHYRVVKLVTGDLSFASAKTYDIEVWAPGANKYLEVSSISNFEDFQARRADIRYRDENGKVQFLHTLNGSGLATPRTFVALLENYQNEDGTISIPEILRPYMNNLDKI